MNRTCLHQIQEVTKLIPKFCYDGQIDSLSQRVLDL